MLQPCSNPFCSVEFEVGRTECPKCGTAVEKPAAVAAPPKPMARGKQIMKSVIFTLIGAAPGGVWLAMSGTTQAAVIFGLGALIGLGLSLPGVSAARVAGGTVGAIAAYNAPRSMREGIMEHFVPEEKKGKDDD